MDQAEFKRRVQELRQKGKGTKPAPTSSDQKEDGRLERQTDVLKDRAAAARDICFRHAEATRKTEALRTEIIHGLNAGDDFRELFFKAAEVIGLATGDTGFLPIVKDAVRQRDEQ